MKVIMDNEAMKSEELRGENTLLSINLESK